MSNKLRSLCLAAFLLAACSPASPSSSSLPRTPSTLVTQAQRVAETYQIIPIFSSEGTISRWVTRPASGKIAIPLDVTNGPGPLALKKLRLTLKSLTRASYPSAFPSVSPPPPIINPTSLASSVTPAAMPAMPVPPVAPPIADTSFLKPDDSPPLVRDVAPSEWGWPEQLEPGKHYDLEFPLTGKAIADFCLAHEQTRRLQVEIVFLAEGDATLPSLEGQPLRVQFEVAKE